MAGERLPDELCTLIFHETTAATIDSYEPIFLPGLVQTEDYARALFRECGRYSGDDAEFRVRARMDRQCLVKRVDPPQCSLYIHENPLRLTVGSNSIMHQQLLHLVFITSRPQFVIRVVPASAGVRGLSNGPFKRMTYRQDDPVVYLEHDVVSLFLDAGQYVGVYRDVLRMLDNVALDEGRSRMFLADLANEYDRRAPRRDSR